VIAQTEAEVALGNDLIAKAEAEVALGNDLIAENQGL